MTVLASQPDMLTMEPLENTMDSMMDVTPDDMVKAPVITLDPPADKPRLSAAEKIIASYRQAKHKDRLEQLSQLKQDNSDQSTRDQLLTWMEVHSHAPGKLLRQLSAEKIENLLTHSLWQEPSQAEKPLAVLDSVLTDKTLHQNKNITSRTLVMTAKRGLNAIEKNITQMSRHYQSLTEATKPLFDTFLRHSGKKNLSQNKNIAANHLNHYFNVIEKSDSAFQDNGPKTLSRLIHLTDMAEKQNIKTKISPEFFLAHATSSLVESNGLASHHVKQHLRNAFAMKTPQLTQHYLLEFENKIVDELDKQDGRFSKRSKGYRIQEVVNPLASPSEKMEAENNKKLLEDLSLYPSDKDDLLASYAKSVFSTTLSLKHHGKFPIAKTVHVIRQTLDFAGHALQYNGNRDKTQATLSLGGFTNAKATLDHIPANPQSPLTLQMNALKQNISDTCDTMRKTFTAIYGTSVARNEIFAENQDILPGFFDPDKRKKSYIAKMAGKVMSLFS